MNKKYIFAEPNCLFCSIQIMNDHYQPVSCSFVDYIEDFATRRVSGKIVYISMDKREEIIDVVKTWVNEDGEEYLITSVLNKKIRLDRILNLFGMLGPANPEYLASCF